MKSLLLVTLATLGLTASTMAQNLPNYVPANGLVGWWPFNDNANDESGNGNNGTVNGATLSADRFGNSNKAYSFDGLSNRIDLPLNLNGSLLNLTSFSISGYFITFTHDLNGDCIFSNWKAFPFQDPFGINVGTSNKFGSGNCAGTGVSSLDTIQNNQWSFFTVVFDGSQTNALTKMKLFLNGLQVASDSGATVYSNYTVANSLGNQATNTAFGAWFSQFGWIGHFNGKLDDIGIWNRSLTQQEITDLYNGNSGITGFNSVALNNTIQIFPNPANGHISIDYGNFEIMNGYQLKIQNSIGQQLFQTNITQQTDYLSLNNWGGNGLYFVHIIDAQGNTIDIRKIVLQ